MKGMPVDELLAAAFDRASGRTPEGDAPPPAALLAFARRVVDAGRRVAAQPACPQAVFARAQRLADDRPARRPAAALLRLLFDSWARPRPALRGGRGPRFLRFGGPGGALDVEVAPEATGGVRLRGTVDAPESGLVVVVKGAWGRPVRAPVGAGGVFEVAIPATSRPYTISVASGRAVVLRSVPVPPRTRS